MRLSRQTEGIMPVRANLHAQVNRASFVGTGRKSWLRLYILAFLERTEDEFSRLEERKKKKKTVCYSCGLNGYLLLPTYRNN